jgi:hypothetical protein|tara:strand:- start:3199 stop:3804 length:606 start_codon:yes stop_codon:yes gene_type:complete
MGLNALKVGTKVRFLDEVGNGIVTKILSEAKVMVEDDSGFEYPYDASRLLVIEDAKEEKMAYERVIPSVLEIVQQDLSAERKTRIEKDFKTKYKEANARSNERSDMEVDLHMHAIVDSQSGLEPSTMLELQLAHFERMLQIGIRQRMKKLVFIHGIGQGVLRHQIWSRVDQYYPDCSCRSADPREYGSGATEVWIGERAFN